jgi:hypothetical protein
MRSRQNPTSAAAEETIRGTQQATEIGLQLAPVRIGVSSAACGRRSKCIHSTLAASPGRNVDLGPPAGCFVFLSAQMQFPFTQHEKVFHCTHYGSLVRLSDNRVPCPLNPNPLPGGTGRETRRRFYGTGYQRQPAFHFKSDEPEFQPGRSHFGLLLNQRWDGVMQALAAPFCLVGLGHRAFLWAVSKNKPFADSHNRGCPLIRG